MSFRSPEGKEKEQLFKIYSYIGIRCSMENFGELEHIKVYPPYAAGKL